MMIPYGLMNFVSIFWFSNWSHAVNISRWNDNQAFTTNLLGQFFRFHGGGSLVRTLSDAFLRIRLNWKINWKLEIEKINKGKSVWQNPSNNLIRCFEPFRAVEVLITLRSCESLNNFISLNFVIKLKLLQRLH